MIGFDEAMALVAGVAAPLDREIVPLGEAQGRVLARPVIARVASPSSDASAMDGYAVRESDLRRLPARLRIVGESFPGRGWEGALGAGECVRIFTGASLPSGADRVVMQEIVEVDGDVALFSLDPGKEGHFRRRGSDFEAGDVLVEPPRLLDARAMVAAAAADLSELSVFRRPRLAILSTGDELVAPGAAGGQPQSVPDSVSLGVAALAKTWGAHVALRRRLRDDLPALQEAAGEALVASDLVVVTGGASVGERDFAKAMFEPAGLALIFSKVAMKPGKPVWLGTAAGRLVMGLPGNPTSALVTARLLLAPLLAGLTGREPSDALPWRRAPLAEPIEACGGRETFVRACWAGDAVRPLSNQDSSAQSTLAAAELLLRRQADSPAAAAGELVEVLDF